MADRLKDDFFEKKYNTDKESHEAKIAVTAKLEMLSDIIGIPNFMQAFKVAQVRK